MTSILERVKANALSLHEDLNVALEKEDRNVTRLRVRVVVFRDVTVDGAQALEASEFFTLPQDHDDFVNFVKRLAPLGGGDPPESGLEALAIAMHSDWAQDDA